MSDPDPISPERVGIVRDVRRTLTTLVVATVLLALVVGGVAAYTYVFSHRNTVALCALRSDVQKRVEQSQQFLIDHPGGLPGTGITAAVIKQGIDSSQRTVRALDNLSC